MAAYPTLPWMVDGTKVDRTAGFEADRATNGVLKTRVLYSADKRDFNLVHWLTDAQKATLEAFYGTNKLLDITLTAADDGASYTVRFAAIPVYEWRVGYWIARVLLKQT